MKINEGQWRQLSQKTDYTESYSESEPTKEKSNSSSYSKPTFDLSGFKYVFYFIVAALIIFVIVKILMNLNSEHVPTIDNISVNYNLSEVEEKIMKVDLDKILKEAIDNKDYRLAFRINFLIIIKALAGKGRIDWAKEKTNLEYCSEIKDSDIAAMFKEIVFIFENVWYGDHDLTESQYYNLQTSYENFKTKLG